MNDLESFLLGLGSGTSGGEFTIDFTSALRKLREYSLAAGDRHLDCLVMSAVAAGATKAWFVQNQEDTTHTFFHNGVHPTVEQMKGLFSAILGENESLRYLAMALSGCLHGDWVKVDILAGQKRFRYSQDGLEVDNAECENFQMTCPGHFGTGVFRTLGKKAQYAPLGLYYEEILLNNPDTVPEHDTAATLRLFHPGIEGDHLVVTPGFGKGRGWSFPDSRLPSTVEADDARAETGVRAFPSVLHCSAVILRYEEPEKASEIRFFRHGVELERRPWASCPGVVCLCGTEGLRLDLSGLRVVVNSQLEALESRLLRELRRLDSLLKKAYPYLKLKERLSASRVRY